MNCSLVRHIPKIARKYLYAFVELQHDHAFAELGLAEIIVHNHVLILRLFPLFV
jgi:hypothetical protein